jgi:uncharacterized phiE125 gp8 family phage protein
MMQLLKQAPILLIALHELKHHLRIEHTHDDTYLESTIQAATQMVENYIGRSLLSKQWRKIWTCQGASTNGGMEVIPLSFPPVVDVESIVHVHSEFQKIQARRYRLIPGEQPTLEVYTTAPHVEITYKAGYGDYPDQVERPLRQAILLCASDLYENRTQYALEANSALMALLYPYRVLRLI